MPTLVLCHVFSYLRGFDFLQPFLWRTYGLPDDYADRVELGRRGRFRAYAFSLGDRAPAAPAEISSPPPLATHLATSVSDSSLSTVAAPPDPVLASTVIDAFAEAPMDLDGDLGADGDPTAFLTDDALAELVGEALAPGAGAAMVTPEASPGLTPCGCRIQPTQFFQ